MNEDQVREKFEAWVKIDGMSANLYRSELGSYYLDAETENAWHGYQAAYAQARREALLKSLSVREGWVLVPIDPTENMVIDGFESEPSFVFSPREVWEEYDAMTGCQQAAHRARLCWAAMIASSPKQEREANAHTSPIDYRSP